MEEENIDIDMAAALNEMSSEFSGGSDSEESAASPPDGSLPVAPAPQDGSKPATSPALSDPWRALPKSWKKDLEPYWQKLDPNVMQYVHEREKQALEGIMQYKTAYDPYAQLEQHYKPWLDHYQIKMPEVTQRLINTHIALMHAPEEQKAQYLQALIKDYNLQPLLQKMFGGASGQPQPQVPPELLNEVNAIRQKIELRERAEQEAALKESQEAVDKFIADPQNEFAQEVLPDMVRLVKSGLATDLKSAYEQAIWHNPATRAKLLEREVGKVTKPKGPAPRVVRTSSAPPASTKPQDEDIDATLARVYEEINSR